MSFYGRVGTSFYGRCNTLLLNRGNGLGRIAEDVGYRVVVGVSVQPYQRPHHFI